MFPQIAQGHPESVFSAEMVMYPYCNRGNGGDGNCVAGMGKKVEVSPAGVCAVVPARYNIRSAATVAVMVDFTNVVMGL